MTDVRGQKSDVGRQRTEAFEGGMVEDRGQKRRDSYLLLVIGYWLMV